MLILVGILATSQFTGRLQAAKHSALMAFPAMAYKMETVTTPLGHRKERQVGVDRPLAMQTNKTQVSTLTVAGHACIRDSLT